MQPLLDFDFHSEKYIGIFDDAIRTVEAQIGTLQVTHDFERIAASLDYAAGLKRHTKAQTQSDKLDRHKMLAIITLSIIHCKPLTALKQNPSSIARYCNVLVAMHIFERIMYQYTSIDFCNKYGYRSTEVDKSFGHLVYPDQTKDELDVSGSLMQSIFLVEQSLSEYSRSYAQADKSKIFQEQQRFLFLLSHIFFYIEQFNLNNYMHYFRIHVNPKKQATPMMGALDMRVIPNSSGK